MATDLEVLTLRVEASLTQFEKALAKANSVSVSNMRKLEKTTQASATRIERVYSNMAGRVGNEFKGMFSGMLAGLSAGVFIQAIGRAVNSIAELGEMAERIGVTTDALQALHRMAVMTGASVEEMDKALQSLAEQAADTGSFLNKLFTANGLKMSQDMTENVRSFMTLMRNARNEQERLLIATKVFGDRVGRQLVEAFSQGGDAVDRVFREMTAAGQTHSKKQIEEIKKIRDQYNLLMDQLAVGWQTMTIHMIDQTKLLGSSLQDLVNVAAQLGTIFSGQSGKSFADNIRDAANAAARVGSFIGGQPLLATPAPRVQRSRSPYVGPSGGGAGSTTLPPTSDDAAALKESAGIFEKVSKDFVDKLIQIESRGIATAKNPLSSATGLGQFTEATWMEMYKKAFPQDVQDRVEHFGEETARQQILLLRNNADLSRQMIEEYAASNAKILNQAGIAVTDASLYLAHFLGPGGAFKVLSANPNQPVAPLVGPNVMKANPFLEGKTAGQTLEWAEKKIASSSKVVAAVDAETAALDRERGALEDTSFAADKLRKIQELTLERQKELAETGGAFTAQDVANIDARADAWAKAKHALEDYQTTQTLTSQQMDEIRNLASDVFHTIADGIRAGESAAQIFSKVLDQIGSKLIDVGISMLTSSLFGAQGTAGGGALGTLLGGLFGARASGGPVSQGKGYVVGEHGSELFVPNTSGQIVPSGRFTGGPSKFELLVTLSPDLRQEIAQGDEHSVRVATQQADRNTRKNMPAYVRDVQRRRQ